MTLTRPTHILRILVVVGILFIIKFYHFISNLHSGNKTDVLVQETIYIFDNNTLEISLEKTKNEIHGENKRNFNLSHFVKNDNVWNLQPNVYCLHNEEDCAYGIKTANRVKELNQSNIILTNGFRFEQIYVRKAPEGLPDWLLYFFDNEQCKQNCKLVEFNDLTVRAHATLKLQGLVRKESHEIQINANLEPDYHETILECLESQNKYCWHASFFLKSTLPLMYSFNTYGKGVLNLLGDIKLETNDRTERWIYLFNSFSHSVYQNHTLNRSNSPLGVAFVSRLCDRHNNFFSRLMQKVKIDMMGKCMRSRNEDEFDVFNERNLRSLWWKNQNDITKSKDLKKIIISSKYKFFLSIENTIMEDYLTEKFWAGFLADTVMVYLGAPNADMYAPAQYSFINVLHFESVESLGDYLLYLSSNPVEYNKYKIWKKSKTVSPFFLSHVYDNYDNPPLCKLCSKLATIK